MKKTNKAAVIRKKGSENVFYMSKLSNSALLKELNISKFGDNKNRKKRTSKFGLNVSKKVNFNPFKVSLKILTQPFNLLLIGLIVLDFLTYFIFKKDDKEIGEIVSASVSGIILIMTYVIGMAESIEYFKSDMKTRGTVVNTFPILRQPIDDVTNIRFESIQKDLGVIQYSKITVGDVLVLSVGDIVPADMRVIWSHNFKVDDNFIRGKQVRMKKSYEYMEAENVYDLNNMLLSHSFVTDGHAICVVIGVGKKKVSNHFIRKTEKENVNFYERGLKRITLSLLLSALVVLPVSFLSVYLTTDGKNGNALDTLLYAITIVVSLIPESLPAIIGFILQYGNRQIKNENIIVKKLDTIQDLGALDVFISGLRGPITKGKPYLVNWVNFENVKDDRVYDLAYLNAYFQKSLHFHYENAILQSSEEIDPVVHDYEIIEKYNSKNIKNGSVYLVDKNEIEIKIVVSTFQDAYNSIKYYRKKESIKKITDDMIFSIHSLTKEYISQGFEPLLVLSKYITEENVNTQENLCFEGVIVFKDELRDGADESVLMFDKYNIDFKIESKESTDLLTKIGLDVGLKNLNHLSGDEIIKMSQNDLKFELNNTDIFAQLSSYQKALIIKTYQKSEKVVGFLGNGHSDILAIKTADVGIVPNNAAPLAKKFADIIILEPKLTTFDKGINWGRKTFLNTKKFLKIAISTNIGLFLSLIILGMIFPFKPISTTGLLIQNLLIDLISIAFMVDPVNDQMSSTSIKWNKRRLVVFSAINAIAQPVVSIINMSIVCWGFNLYNGLNTTEDNIKIIQTIFFVETYVTRILLFFILRTHRLRFLKEKQDYRFVVPVLLSLVIVCVIPYITLFDSFTEMSPIMWYWWFIMLMNCSITMAISTSVKYLYHIKNWNWL